jgi:hypothetical protein
VTFVKTIHPRVQRKNADAMEDVSSFRNNLIINDVRVVLLFISLSSSVLVLDGAPFGGKLISASFPMRETAQSAPILKF